MQKKSKDKELLKFKKNNNIKKTNKRKNGKHGQEKSKKREKIAQNPIKRIRKIKQDKNCKNNIQKRTARPILFKKIQNQAKKPA